MENREYVIVTDSTTDMDPQYYDVNNIKIVSLHYTIGSKTYTQYAHDDLTTENFYSKIRDGVMPKSTPITYEDVTNTLEKIVNDGKDVFFLAFSSALSQSYQTAQIAAEDIMTKHPECTIKVVDSTCASGGEGLLLHLCVKKRNSGVSLEELEKYAERMKGHIVHLFTVDNLNHLHRGGRLSKLSAVMGTILSVKPLLHVENRGSLASYDKIKGRKKSLETMADHMKQKYLPGENEEIFIFDADCSEDAEYLGNCVMNLMPDVKRIRYGHIGAVIGSHTGAGAILLTFVGKNRNPIE
ncbi:MAG: DegV family protein [Oscillospiraceae bacterium]|nr:DegV family protein [Oscillospiraceae bacterium]